MHDRPPPASAKPTVAPSREISTSRTFRGNGYVQTCLRVTATEQRIETSETTTNNWASENLNLGSHMAPSPPFYAFF